MRSFVAASCVALLAALVPPAAHADSFTQARKAAAKALKKNTKPVLKVVIDEINAQRDTALDAIDAWDDEVKQDGFAAVGYIPLASAISDYLLAAGAAARNLTDALGQAEDESYDIAAAATLPAYRLGDDFRVTAGGRIDDVLAKVVKALDGADRALERRLSKLAKRLRKSHHLAFAFHLERPFSPIAPLATANGWTNNATVVFPPNLDAALYFSDLEVDSDVQGAVFGSTAPQLDPLTVRRVSQNFSESTVVLQAAISGRFAVAYLGLLEGNLAFSISVGGAFDHDLVVLGIE